MTGDHSTPVEYGDHSFEPVPFALCRLRDFVGAIGSESILGEISLEPFPLPTVKAGEDLPEDCVSDDNTIRASMQAYSGDSVFELSEIAASRGCLGPFPGSEMMGIINAFLKLKF